MNLFQSTLKGLSDHDVKISTIATNSQKSVSSIRNEIKRLKQTQWIGRWITYDKMTDTARLAAPLRGIGYEALEFMVKQFYNSDRKSGKKFDAHHTDISNLHSPVDEIDKYLNGQWENTKKIKDKDIGLLTI